MKEVPDTPAELKARALRHLVRREHSRAELARKLAQHAESPEALEVLLDSLVSRKQRSDERFAHERARSLSRKFGSAKIRYDLKSKPLGYLTFLMAALFINPRQREALTRTLVRFARELASDRAFDQ